MKWLSLAPPLAAAAIRLTYFNGLVQPMGHAVTRRQNEIGDQNLSASIVHSATLLGGRGVTPRWRSMFRHWAR